MKYCATFIPNKQNYDEFDEIIVSFEDIPPKKLLIFLEEANQRNQTVIFDMSNAELDNFVVFSNMRKCQEKYPQNFKLMISACRHDYSSVDVCYELAKTLKNAGIPFYFKSPVSSWDIFCGLIELGVSDILICNELGFDLERISKIAKENHVQIRCYPNIAQSSWEAPETPAWKFFWIRPEDTSLYEKYIDVLEFFPSGKAYPEDPVETWLKIYKKERKWDGKLFELIFNFSDKDIDNSCLMKEFSNRRINCKKKCNQNRCGLCHSFFNLAKTIEERAKKEVKN